MKILLVGFGHVGRKVAEIMVMEKNKYPGLDVAAFSIAGIITRRHGSLMYPSVKDISGFIYQNQGKMTDKINPGEDIRSTTLRFIRECQYDVMVELSPLSISEKGEPAITYIREALTRGKHVVSANKGPVAFAYDELSNLASKNRVHFLFESAVMDGTPVFNLVHETLKGCTIDKISGILNSTTNFILSAMEDGVSFRSALRSAQEEGVTESDPSHDIEGWDAAVKITTLANVLMNAQLKPFEVKRTGISGITAETVHQSVSKNKRLKLIARAWRESGHVKAAVQPEEVGAEDPFSTIKGTSACLRIETDLMEPVMISQVYPKVKDTAYGIISDLLTIRETTNKPVP